MRKNHEIDGTMRFIGCWVFFFLVFGISLVHSENRSVRVGIYENAPKVFVDETGAPAGIFIDLIEYIAESEGWNLRYVPGTWGEGLDRLEKGEIDLMPDVAHTADREKIFDFHRAPVLSSWFQVYARKGSGIHSILDLAGKRIAVLERSVQQEAFVRLSTGFGLSVNLISLPDYQTIFERVARDEADAAITNRFYGLMHAKRFGLEDTAVIFNPSDLFFAAPRGTHEELLNAVDAHLIEMKKDTQSVYYKSLKRWVSEEARFKLPDWVKAIGLVAAVILIMSLAGSVILKKQVKARTRELQQINLQMEQRIVERTAELAAAMERAETANRVKSAFLSSMSHELRTPLNSIIGFTGIILNELAGPLNLEQKKQLKMVKGSSHHLLNLINDVLDISKIEAGELEISCEKFNMRDVISQVAEALMPLAEQKGLALFVEISPEVNVLASDERRVRQVLINLTNNAIKFTEKGTVKIVCFNRDTCMEVEIRDSGIGIRDEDMDKLFKPFQQLDTGISRKYEGTGLGLSVCKRILDMLGGKIRVKSQFGKGSTFTFTLPLNPEEKNDEKENPDH